MNRHRHSVPLFDHLYGNANIQKANERRTQIVVWVTLATMIAEIIAGVMSGSMALLSDGWHMGTHAGALGIAFFAYHYARTHRSDSRYTFGTGKVGELGAFASAIILGITGILILYESANRLLHPQEIQFNTAIFVAVIGLIVNLICAAILGGGEHHHHHEHHHHDATHEHKEEHHEHIFEHEHEHEHEHIHEQEHELEHIQEHEHIHDREEHSDEPTDHNLHAAFLHVLADALTSVLAIAALIVGKFYHVVMFDSLAGILGGVMILIWSYGLIRRTSRVLLDGDVEPQIIEEIRNVIESDADNEVIDLHVWRVGESALAAIIVLVSDRPNSPEYYRSLLTQYTDLKHVVVEVNHCHCGGNDKSSEL